MTDPIKPGDLVAVVKPLPCCGSTMGIGIVSTVYSISNIPIQCAVCGYTAIRTVATLKDDRLSPLPVLKKLNPPESEMSKETTKKSEEICVLQSS